MLPDPPSSGAIGNLVASVPDASLRSKRKAASDHAQRVASAGNPSTLLGAAGLQLRCKVPDRAPRAVVASVPDAALLNFAAPFFLQPGCWLDSELLGRYGFSMSTKDMVAALERFDEVELARFVDELEKHDKLAENLYDLLAFRMRAQEPMRPFEEFVQDLQAKR